MEEEKPMLQGWGGHLANPVKIDDPRTKDQCLPMRKEVYAIFRRNAKTVPVVLLAALVVLSFRFASLEVDLSTQVFTFTLKVQ